MTIALGKYVAISSVTKPMSTMPRRPNSILIPHRQQLLNYVEHEHKGLRTILCNAIRRRIRYGEESNDSEDNGHNEEIAMLELYSQSAREEVLLVNALVDDQDVQVLIFKGFSSCLSHGTSADPSKSVLPARALIKSIDRVKGPFEPSDIKYIQKGLTWEDFKSNFFS